MQSIVLRKTRETDIRKRTTFRRKWNNKKLLLRRKNKGTADQSRITRKKLHKSKETNKHNKKQRTLWKANSRKSFKKQKTSKKLRQICNSPVPVACIKNATDVLLFEGNQVKNFIKQYKRFNTQKKQVESKFEKRNRFEGPKNNLDFSIGNNRSSLSCKNSATSRVNFDSVYTTLSNCSDMIEEACKIPEVDQDKMDTCNENMKSFLPSKEKDCRTNDPTCQCWEEFTGKVQFLKDSKCTKTMSDYAKKMKKQKKQCTDQFKICKKAEDSSIGVIYECQNKNYQET